MSREHNSRLLSVSGLCVKGSILEKPNICFSDSLKRRAVGRVCTCVGAKRGFTTHAEQGRLDSRAAPSTQERTRAQNDEGFDLTAH